MATISVMTTGVNLILAALTPVQRWHAARQAGGSFMSERWFILTGLIAIIILTALLIVVSYQHRAQEHKLSDKRFFEYANKIGLTRHERQILRDIAARAELRRNESVFSMIEAFDRGASGIIEDTLALEGIDASRRLNTVMSTLREKLGFEKQYPTSVGSERQSSRPTSRQIPKGKKLYLTYPDADEPTDIECTVIKNDDVQLTARSAAPLQSNSGKRCRVRYGFGGSVWEFDASVVSCQGDLLALTHSDNVRFINRRRFLRVPVRKPALVAHFPFLRTLSMGGEKTNMDSMDDTENRWGTLDFVPAVVTELAGPGLRLETPLQVKIGERVVIMFKLSEENDQDLLRSNEENSLQSYTERKGKMTPLKVVEDIGEIRHTEAAQSGFSTGVELMGLSDSDVNELIRATNTASGKADTDTLDAPISGGQDGQKIPEPALT